MTRPIFLSSIHTFFSAFQIYLQANVIRILFLGFSAGIPIMLVFSTLSVWLKEAGVERASIGFFSWITLAYAFKWVWAPVIDRLSLPYLTSLLGRRRAWLITSQVGLITTILFMAMTDPAQSLQQMAIAAVLVAFCSATQDIVLDAFRIESGETKEQAAMAAAYLMGYRVAMIFATAGALLVAENLGTSIDNYQVGSWQTAYIVVAASMVIGVIATLMSPEPKHEEPTKSAITKRHQGNVPRQIYYALIQPVIDLFQRFKWLTVVLLVLVCTYRMSDIVMGVMANVFYIDMGYTKADIAELSKTFGLIMTLLGAFFAGGLINKYGLLKIMLVGAVLSAITNILFIFLSQAEPSRAFLAAVITVDNLSAGIATASLIAFLSSLTNREFTATQYAWLSSVMVLLPKFLGGFSGVWLESLGYTQFFTMTAIIGLPAAICILVLMKKGWQSDNK